MGFLAMGQRDNEAKWARRRRTICIPSGLQNVLLFTRFAFGLGVTPLIVLATFPCRHLHVATLLVATLILSLRQVSDVLDVASCLKGWVELDSSSFNSNPIHH